MTTQPTTKKRRRWPWILGGILALIVIVSAINDGGDEPSAVADSGPTIPTLAEQPTAPVEQAPAPAPVAPAPAPVQAPEPAEPEMTVSQENAREQAESYLDFAAFSRTGLIKQLEFEGYSAADAEFAVDAVSADWMEQAVKKAESYLELTSFSRSGLIDQLEFDGFTSAEAEHGVTAAGL